MKISNFKPINFQKRLVANCQIGASGNNVPTKIYLLDKRDDFGVLDKAKDKEIWQNGYYISNVSNNFCVDLKHANHYVMETDDGDVICMCKAKEKGKKVNLEYIETAPKMSSYNHTRKLKYIGETMLAFLVKEAKENKKIVDVPTVAMRPKTLDFYFNQCGFKKDGKLSATMPREEANTFIKKNEKHTGSPIEIL